MNLCVLDSGCLVSIQCVFVFFFDGHTWFPFSASKTGPLSDMCVCLVVCCYLKKFNSFMLNSVVDLLETGRESWLHQLEVELCGGSILLCTVRVDLNNNYVN